MKAKTEQNENIIRGSCTYFVCHFCRTKYGWEHQPWCDNYSLTEPGCQDCQYYSERRRCCIHPARKARRSKGRDALNERD